MIAPMRLEGGSTAVVTGAANGIGAALARAVAARGLDVVLADIDTDGLERTRREVAAHGVAAHVVVTDVRDPDAMARLAERAFSCPGPLQLLANHAGVLVTGESWLAPLEDWRWVMGVNLGGVVHALRAFVPGMLAAARPAHVVNASSIGAVLTEAGAAPYTTALRGVITVSESLVAELAALGAPIGVSVVCAGAVASDLGAAERHRPAHLARPAGFAPSDASVRSLDAKRAGMAAGLAPDDAARVVLDGVEADRFLVFVPGPERYAARVRAATERLLAGDPPA